MKDIMKNPQEIQDALFRKMSPDQKLEMWYGLWKLAKELVGDKIHYGKNRPAATPHQHR